MEHRGQHRDEREPDHDQQERHVAERRGAALGHADRDVAEHGGDGDEPADREHAAERASNEDQQDQRADRVGRHPFRGQGEAQQQADDRHGEPERPAALPEACPDRGEQRVRGDDEEPDERVVHRDPRLREQHAVDQREQAGQQRHLPPPEEDAREHVQETGHQRAGDHPGHPPAERVLTDLDRRPAPVRTERQELLAIAARASLVDVEGPRRGVERAGARRRRRRSRVARRRRPWIRSRRASGRGCAPDASARRSRCDCRGRAAGTCWRCSGPCPRCPARGRRRHTSACPRCPPSRSTSRRRCP